MSESSSDDLNGVKLSFHKKTLKFKKQILKAGISRQGESFARQEMLQEMRAEMGFGNMIL